MGWLPARRNRWFVDIVQERALPDAAEPPAVLHHHAVGALVEVSIELRLRSTSHVGVDTLSWMAEEWLDAFVTRLETLPCDQPPPTPAS